MTDMVPAIQAGKPVTGRMPRPRITFWARGNCIYIGKDVIRLLGNPSHICLLVNKSRTSMVVKESDASEVMSFKVPENLHIEKRKLLIYSKQFVSEIRQINGMLEHVSYDVPGSYSEKHHIVIFQLTDSRPTI